MISSKAATSVKASDENKAIRFFFTIDCPVSMNMWGLPASFLDELGRAFRSFYHLLRREI